MSQQKKKNHSKLPDRLIVTNHAVDRYLERVDSKISREEAKAKIYALTVDNFMAMNMMDAQYPIGNKYFSVVRDRCVVTVSKQTIVCEHKPVPKTKKKRFRNE